jgi:hypothetical protein
MKPGTTRSLHAVVATDLEPLLEGDRAALAALAAGDQRLWQALLEHLIQHKPAVAPRPFVDALVAENSSFERWVRSADRAASDCSSRLFATVHAAMRVFLPWLIAGLRAARASNDPVILEMRRSALLLLPPARVGELEPPSPEETLAEAQSLLRDARGAWGASAQLGELLLIVHRRAAEAHRHDLAFDAASEAERLFEGEGTAKRARFARRLRAASLLQLGRVMEGLDLLEPLLTEDGPLFAGGGCFRIGGVGRSPAERALDDLADTARWHAATDSTWVAGLGGVAERCEGLPNVHGLWNRYERALEAMLQASSSPREDLESVVRQTADRYLAKAAARAKQIGWRSGIVVDG